MQGTADSSSVCFLLAVVKFSKESTLKGFDHHDQGYVFGETHIPSEMYFHYLPISPFWFDKQSHVT